MNEDYVVLIIIAIGVFIGGYGLAIISIMN